MNTRQVYRHGDLNISPSNLNKNLKSIHHSGSFVLALGEQTGHRHVITVERPQDMVIYDAGSGCFVLELSAPGTLTHQEHGSITLPPGTFRVGREREFDWFGMAVRQVVD